MVPKPKTPEPAWRLLRIDGETQVIVDAYSYDWLRQYDWKVYRHQRSIYVKYTRTINGKQKAIYMHRLIAMTPTSMTCHHRNRNTLDNRRKNLLNMTKKEHQALHQNHSLLIAQDRFAPEPVDLSAFYGT